MVVSFAWKKKALTGTAVTSSGGRLAVIVGFNAGGSPIVNDPAAASDVAVYRAYALSELETLWLQAHREGGYIHTRL